MSASIRTSRQKACDACVKGKRRCDRVLPSCSRCAAKDVVFSYGGSNTVSSAGVEISDLDNSRLASDTIQYSIQEHDVETPQILDPSLPKLPYESYQSNLDEPDFETMVTQRLLSQAKTPFIHPELLHEGDCLYEPLQDAFCVCALYLNKTDRIIDSKSDALLSYAGNWSIAESLACVQAMILFQIIRLFDGDIRQRAIAEQQESVLTLWTAELRRRTRGYPSVAEPSWHDWLFAESVRITILVSAMLKGIYDVVKNGHCVRHDDVTMLPFTAQAALWNAPSAYSWKRAFRDKEHYPVTQMCFDDIISSGKSSDVEDLGLMMMVTYLGVDQVREWASQSGEELVNFSD
ncbi:hypothetical protein F5884DRAFT_856786 [Xylogone sp. PMI_703]|nr:hypothetical protein F5884DRAFT_856786 [Xylogone sp. PMI_703]